MMDFRSTVIFAVVLICLPCFAYRDALVGASPSVYNEHHSHPRSRKTRFQQLKTDILLNKIKSSQNLLQFFSSSKQYRPFINSPVLEFESDALHGDEVSERFPRIVLGDGTMTLHLIGDPRSKGSQLVEFIEYLPDEGHYSFSVINFALWGDSRMFLEDLEFKTHIDSEIQRLYTQSIGQFFSCAACHSASSGTMLPVWNAGSSLHKAFGHGDDFVDRLEEKSFEQFLNTQNDPQLGVLYKYLNIDFSRTSDGIEFGQKPNQRLTRLIFKSLRERLAYSLRDSAGIKRIYATVGAFLDCDSIESFVPDELRGKHEQELLSAMGHYPLPLTMLDLRTLNPNYINDVEVSDGNFAFLIAKGESILSESALMKHFLGPLSVGLRETVERSNEVLHFFTSRRMPLLALQMPARLIENDFESNSYLSTIAKLRYVHDGRPDSAIFVFNEFDVHGGHPHSSYRIDEGMKGLQKVLSEEIGPDFRSTNPDLDFFQGGIVDQAHLTIPKATYCQLLREKSLHTWN